MLTTLLCVSLLAPQQPKRKTETVLAITVQVPGRPKDLGYFVPAVTVIDPRSGRTLAKDNYHLQRDQLLYVSNLPRGDYTVQISHPGFLTQTLKKVPFDRTVNKYRIVLLSGDLNGDNTINQLDLGLLNANLGADVWSEKWFDRTSTGFYQAMCDLNGDEKVDGRDVGLMVSRFGKRGN